MSVRYLGIYGVGFGAFWRSTSTKGWGNHLTERDLLKANANKNESNVLGITLSGQGICIVLRIVMSVFQPHMLLSILAGYCTRVSIALGNSFSFLPNYTSKSLLHY